MSDSCDPINCSLLGSSVHGISQARILEWVAISSSSVSWQPRDWTQVSSVSCIGRQILHHWVSRLKRPTQPQELHLSASWSAPTEASNQRLLSRPISVCQPLEKYLSATLSATISRLISTCQRLYQHLSAAWLVPVSCLTTAHSADWKAPMQPRDKHQSAAWKSPVSSLISACVRWGGLGDVQAGATRLDRRGQGCERLLLSIFGDCKESC